MNKTTNYSISRTELTSGNYDSVRQIEGSSDFKAPDAAPETTIAILLVGLIRDEAVTVSVAGASGGDAM